MHRDGIPTISVGLIVRTGAAYDTRHHWPNSAGVWHASVSFDAGGYSYGHLQGQPAALRELAAALILAAERAERAERAEAAATTTGTTRPPDGVVAS